MVGRFSAPAAAYGPPVMPEPVAFQKSRSGGQGRNRTADTRIFSHGPNFESVTPLVAWSPGDHRNRAGRRAAAYWGREARPDATRLQRGQFRRIDGHPRRRHTWRCAASARRHWRRFARWIIPSGRTIPRGAITAILITGSPPSETEFKAAFAGIEAEMAAQRARLAARPKDAPLVIEQVAGLK